MAYIYQAYTATGELVRGVLGVDTEAAAETALWQANLTVVRLQKQRELPSLDELLPTFFGAKRSDLITVSRQLATLLASGISIVAALRVLGGQVPKAGFRKALRKVVDDIQAGTSFSQACSQHPQFFSGIFVRLLSVGEETGRVDLILNQLAGYFEKEEAISRRIRSALGYPAFVFLLAIASVAVMINFVLPAMAGLYSEFRTELPVITKVVVAVAKFVQANGLIISLLLVTSGVLLWWYSRTPRGTVLLDSIVVRLPIIGNISLKSSTARLTRTMAMLLAAGVSITETLELVVQTTTSPTIRGGLMTVRSHIYTGMPLSQALASAERFPPLLSEVVGIGEQTGRLETNLEMLADFYQEETDRAISTLVSLIEPAMIITVGLIVGIVAVSVISPMYEIMQQVK